MSQHECSLNPFHVLKPIAKEGDADSVSNDRFTFLPSKGSTKKKDVDIMEENENIVDPAGIGF